MYSLLDPEIGHFALAVSCTLSCAIFLSAICAAYSRSFTRLSLYPKALAWTNLLCVSWAFACLAYAFYSDDFSLEIVSANSSLKEPWFYKITGTWGNHEGSTLLWILILSLCTVIPAALSLKPSETERDSVSRLRNKTLAIMGALGALFTLYCEIASNPFTRLLPAPQNGQGMNPLLQDPGLALHPPILYAGYVGFSLPFAIALGALWAGRLPKIWLNFLSKSVLCAWIFLTLGIALGSWWSYYVLGWGGYWFWDPVENASLIPWLSATALIHACIVARKNDQMRIWVLFLSLATFCFSVSGTFLVRSGILNSVHAFASDPTRGIFILSLLALISLPSMALLAIRAHRFETPYADWKYLSAEGALLLNNVLFSTLCLVVLVGTLYPPLIQIAVGSSLSVGKPFFDSVCAPLAWAVLIVLGLSYFLPWDGISGRALVKKIRIPLFFTAVAFLIAYRFLGAVMPAVAASLCIWVMIALIRALPRLLERGNLRALGALIAHCGILVSILGICGMSAAQSDIAQIKIGGEIPLAGYVWRLDAVAPVREPDFDAYRATVSVIRHGKIVATLHPEKRFFVRQRQSNAFVAIKTNFIVDYYAVLAIPSHTQNREEWILRVYYNPLAPWIWGGGLIAALGGLICLSARRRND